MKYLALLWTLAISAAWGQNPAPAFDVASIKPSAALPGASSAINSLTGRIEARNVTLKRCIRGAYGVPEAQIFGGPKWVEEDRYDIDAKAGGPAGDHNLMAMLQTLLAERFHLAIHRETRAMEGYGLVAGKNGLTAKPSEPGVSSISNSSRTSLDCQACSLALMAQKLSEVVHLPVANLTGIDGRYDFHLEWTPEDMQARTPSGDKSGAATAAAAPGVTLFTALTEKLGLKLEARKVPTEVVVIDRAEKPAEN